MVSNDDELERLRSARRAELQNQIEAQTEAQIQAEAQEAAIQQEADQLDEAMKQVLTTEARERLARVEISRPEIALAVKRHLITVAQQGKIQLPIDDETLKAVLAQLNSTRRDTTIRRI